MRISDWSSDVCSSDLHEQNSRDQHASHDDGIVALAHGLVDQAADARAGEHDLGEDRRGDEVTDADAENGDRRKHGDRQRIAEGDTPFRKRSEEHTSELQSLMRISYAVFRMKKKT